MNRTFPLLLAGATLLLGAPSRAQDAPASFSDVERDILRDELAPKVADAIRESAISTSEPIAILPLGGDRGDYALGLFKNSVTDAGRNCIEGRLDPMWETIASEIHWNDIMTRSGALDSTLLTSLGKLQGARMLLYGGILSSTTKDGRARLELTLHISHVVTKQHLWGKAFVGEEPPPPPPPPPPVYTNELLFVNNPIALVDAPVHVFVESSAADGEKLSRKFATALTTEANGDLAKHGYAVCPSAAEAEVVVSIRAEAPVFHRERSFVSLDGTAALVATRLVDNHILGQADLSAARTKLIMGDDAALADLRRSIAPEFLQWLSSVTNPEKVGIHVTSLIVDFATPSTPELEQLIGTLRAAVAELDGVRNVRLVSTLPLPDGKPGSRVTLRVSYFPADLPDGLVASLAAKRSDLFRRTVPVPAK